MSRERWGNWWVLASCLRKQSMDGDNYRVYRVMPAAGCKTPSGRKPSSWYFSSVRNGDKFELLTVNRAACASRRACERHKANPRTFKRTPGVESTWNEVTGKQRGKFKVPQSSPAPAQPGRPTQAVRSAPKQPNPPGLMEQAAATNWARTTAIAVGRYRVARVSEIDGLALPAGLRARLFSACVKKRNGNWQLISIHGSPVAAGKAADRHAAGQATKLESHGSGYQIMSAKRGRRTVFQAWLCDRGKPTQPIGEYLLLTLARKACERHREREQYAQLVQQRRKA